MSVPAPYAARLEKLRSAMRDAAADVYLCDHAEMLAWLTGYTISETFYRACVVPLEGAPVWVLRRIDEVPCRAKTWVQEIVSYADHEDARARVAAVIERFAPAAVGADFGSYGFTAHTKERLQASLPGVRWVDLLGSADTLRAVKDDTEIERMRQAAAIGDGAMREIVARLAPGMRPRDAAAIAAWHYLGEGADDYWVGPISISRRAGSTAHDMGFLHAALHDDALADGDVLHVELVPRVEHYSARFMRSIKLGVPTSEERDVMARLVASQDAQLAAFRPGAVARDVDAILRTGLLAEGLREEFPNISGYQTGLYGRTPRSSDTSLCLHPEARWALEENQTFHLYATARGLAISETVIVTPDGASRLHRTERELLVAGAAPE